MVSRKSTFTKRVGQTTYKVNVFFAENPPLQVCRALSGGKGDAYVSGMTAGSIIKLPV